MSCYRLTFENKRAFELIIDSSGFIEGNREASLCVGVIHRVNGGVRELAPLHRREGTPIEIAAVSEEAVVRIASEVLRQITGARLVTMSACGAAAPLPNLSVGLGLLSLFG